MTTTREEATKRKPPVPIITDHALLRWLERVNGVDVEFFRQKLSDKMSPYVAVGAKRVAIDGFSYEFRENRLTTVQPFKRGKSRRKIG